MHIVSIPLVPQKSYHGDDHWKSDHVLSFIDRRGSRQRAMLGFIGPNGQARQVFQGDLVPGPWAFAFNLGWAITADPRMSTAAERQRNLAAGIEHDIEPGDRVILVDEDGGRAWAFEFSLLRGEFPELRLVEDDDPCIGCGDAEPRPGFSTCADCAPPEPS